MSNWTTYVSLLFLLKDTHLNEEKKMLIASRIIENMMTMKMFHMWKTLSTAYAYTKLSIEFNEYTYREMRQNDK